MCMSSTLTLLSQEMFANLLQTMQILQACVMDCVSVDLPQHNTSSLKGGGGKSTRHVLHEVTIFMFCLMYKMK